MNVNLPVLWAILLLPLSIFLFLVLPRHIREFFIDEDISSAKRAADRDATRAAKAVYEQQYAATYKAKCEAQANLDARAAEEARANQAKQNEKIRKQWEKDAQAYAKEQAKSRPKPKPSHQEAKQKTSHDPKPSPEPKPNVKKQGSESSASKNPKFVDPKIDPNGREHIKPEPKVKAQSSTKAPPKERRTASCASSAAKPKTVKSLVGTHYETLGVLLNADTQTIKQCWRKLSALHHPDRGGDPAMMAKINEAYNVLSNDEARRKYNYQQYLSDTL